jgi:Mg2+-importing ATPase
LRTDDSLQRRIVQTMRGNAKQTTTRTGTPADRQERLRRFATPPANDLLQSLRTSPEGLTQAVVEERRRQYGRNEVESAEERSWIRHLIDNGRNPLVMMLVVLDVIAIASGDVRGAVIIGIMLAIGLVLRTAQEVRSDRAATKLRARVHVTTTVVRDGHRAEVAVGNLVPGDVVVLAAGDMIPADVRLLTSDDLHVDQSMLTGEPFPVAKDAQSTAVATDSLLEHPAMCFHGTSVQTGYGTAVVVATGADTVVGDLAIHLGKQRGPTAFDRGMDSITWLMITIIAVLAPTVMVINGLLRGDWFEALLFGTAVAVGLTPEMLPMIVSVNLSSGALALARRHVIVKRLSAVQDLGAIDVLCTDKTGTLTQGKIILIRHVAPDGTDSEDVLHWGYLNSYFESGLKNLMDKAVLDHEHLEERLISRNGWAKLDENPFDFTRRRLSVLLHDRNGVSVLVCKGAVEEVLHRCADVPPTASAVAEQLQTSGFRVVAVAVRTMPSDVACSTVDDESTMTLVGFLAFLDPPKETAPEALAALARANVRVMVLTGDHALVTRYVCTQVHMQVEHVVTGSEVDAMSAEQLMLCVENTSVFARLEPMQKERIIAALQQCNHVVGFLGDGVNDAPALRKADVGITVDTAVDIAREAADMMLLEQSLMVILNGIHEGRRVFGNVMKYIRMTTSSSFGNVFSYVGASLMLPFIPMLPIQILLNNLLYDLSQMAIPTDRVDASWLAQPRRWQIGDVRTFMLVAGPVSSLFDYVTFGVLLVVFGAASDPSLFHTGWFVESIFSQTLILLVLRNHAVRPFTRPSTTLIISLLVVNAIAVGLTASPIAASLGFVSLPSAYWFWLAGIVLLYVLSTLAVTSLLQRQTGRSQITRTVP